MNVVKRFVLVFVVCLAFHSLADPPDDSEKKAPLSPADEFTLNVIKGVASFPLTRFGPRIKGVMWILENPKKVRQALVDPFELDLSAEMMQKIIELTARAHQSFGLDAKSESEMKQFMRNFPLLAASGINNLFYQMPRQQDWMALSMYLMSSQFLSAVERADEKKVLEDLKAIYQSMGETEELRTFRKEIAKMRQNLWDTFRPLIIDSAWDGFRARRPDTCEETYRSLIHLMNFP